MRLGRLGEDEFTDELARRFNCAHKCIAVGIGDDTSVTRLKNGRAQLVTTDIMIEGTHFSARYTPARLLGRKALAISLSDIAAMGGTPHYCLVSIAVPKRTPRNFLDDLYRGIAECARKFEVALIGGNTSRTTGPAIVATTALGEMPGAEVVTRAGARIGDTVYVTGTVGGAALGLVELKRKGKAALEGPFKMAVRAHLDPVPRLALGRELAKKKVASAMIDISDGLVLDMARLAKASGVRAEIELDSLPLSATMKRYKKNSKSWQTLALAGGEEYELLFTASAKNEKKLAAIAKRSRLRITPIGRIVERKTGLRVVVVDHEGRVVRLKSSGFKHF